jgi:RNA polymerase sigma factor (sigma-70 family)
METADREALILQHIPLVYKLAIRYKRLGQAAGHELEDLVGVGTIALVESVDRYDPERGVKFLTYAFSVVRGEIRHYIRNENGVIKASRNRWERGGRVITVPIMENDAATSPMEAALDRVEIEQLRASLPDCYKPTFDLAWRKANGETYCKIGESLGITGQAVHSRVSRLRHHVTRHRRLSPIFAG